eukprot:2618246-Rhodomonas_salina.2
MRQIWVPAAHTLFSWLPGDSRRVPEGHTRFSWGWVEETEDRDGEIGAREEGKGGQGTEGKDEAKIKKGFLKKEAPPVKEEVGIFLQKAEQLVFSKVLALHEKVCDERTPFAAKYDARGILNTFLQQLDQCAAKEGEGEKYADDIELARTRAEFLLGVNFYDTEEISQGEKLLKEVASQRLR